MPQTPFPFNPVYTAIAIAYRNAKLIADSVLPRVPVSLKEFKYQILPIGQNLTLPNTKVGRKGSPNQVDFTATEETDSVQDYGLDDPIPQDDIDQAAAANTGYDPMAVAVEGLTDLIMLDREVRVAALVFNASNYASGKKIQCGTGGGQPAKFTDLTNSDPIKVISDGLDACIMRPNKMVIGRAAFTRLSTHPKICKAYFGNAGDAGIVPREFVAKLFELDEVLVGEGWVNTAKKGQTVTLSRVWGGNIALLHINPLANTQRVGTFGITAEFGKRIAGAQPDKDIGLRGGQKVRVGESVKELITANDFGYYIQDAV